MGGRGASSSLERIKKLAKEKPNSYNEISKVDKRKLRNYDDKVYSNIVILTNERKEHIYDSHPKDFDRVMRGLKPTIDRPSEILKDNKYSNTLYYIRKLKKDNQNIVIRMNTTNDEKHPHNSIITSWIINDARLDRLRNKAKTIYKNTKK